MRQGYKTIVVGAALILIWVQHCLGQQVIPENGSRINFTRPYFEVPQGPVSGKYVFYIKQVNATAGAKKKVAKVRANCRAAISPVTLSFQATYEWYYKIKQFGFTRFQSPTYTFTTANSELLDTNLQKIVWEKMPPKKQQGIIVLDGLKIAVDMQGKPVFFLPNSKQDRALRDINLTPQGTITYIDNQNGDVAEIDLNGEMLWHYPTPLSKQQSTEHYHHEFEKLPNGNYLLAGKKPIKELNHSSLSAELPGEMLSETIIEVNLEGEEVWRFNLLPELKEQFNLQPPNGSINMSRLGHLNGMAIDTLNNVIYASFKTFNSIFKISRSNNQIMRKIGLETIHFNDSLISGEHFSQQHCPTLLPNGNLLIFNNGTAKTGSGFVELNLQNKEGSATEVVNQVYFKKYFPNEYYTPQMGSAQLVNNNAVLVGMGNKPLFFEVTRNGEKINWIGRTYYNDAWSSKRYNWQPQTNYRVFYYSSLFQYQFVVDTLADNRGIKIINTGTEPDTYEVLWLENDTVLFTQRVSLKPSKSIKLNKNAGKGRLRVVVKSIQCKIIREI
ncbi:MAG: hypothetical protein EAY81_06385 [Bacteroidetes bacterium]|nr:MAG: hypothetical protein EAY81_06385 [Bacteroidota bacterium]